MAHLPMHDFERPGFDADAAVERTVRSTAYKQARLVELSPDLNEATLLEMRVESARRALASARETRALTGQVREAHERRDKSPGLNTAVSADAAAGEAVAVREREFAAATQELAAVQSRIERRESELRTRFGL